MKKIWLLFTMLCFGIVLLSGRIEKKPSMRRVVTQIDIYSQDTKQVTQLHLTDTAHMEAILNYLRALDTQGSANGIPAACPKNAYTIRVGLSDGGCHIYRQRNDRYFCKDSQEWKLIDPKHGSKLPRLTNQLSEGIL